MGVFTEGKADSVEFVFFLLDFLPGPVSLRSQKLARGVLGGGGFDGGLSFSGSPPRPDVVWRICGVKGGSGASSSSLQSARVAIGRGGFDGDIGLPDSRRQIGVIQ